MGVSKNNGTPKSSILTGFSIINHPFWDTPIFGNTHIATSFIHLCFQKSPAGASNSRDGGSFRAVRELVDVAMLDHVDIMSNEKKPGVV